MVTANAAVYADGGRQTEVADGGDGGDGGSETDAATEATELTERSMAPAVETLATANAALSVSVAADRQR